MARFTGVPFSVARGVMSAARQIDRRVEFKALLAVNPQSFDDSSFKWEPSTSNTSTADGVLQEALQGTLYRPHENARELSDVVKMALRDMDVDQALALMAKLRSVIAVGQRVATAPLEREEVWPQLRLATGPLRPGMLLLAHPMLVNSSLRRAIILVAVHNEDTGGYGIVLNVPSTRIVGKAHPDKSFGAFHDCPLHLGGDRGMNNITMLHAFSDLPLSMPIGSELSLGGDMEVISEMIASGSATSNDFLCSSGFHAWYPNQIEGMVDQHLWIPAEVQGSEAHSLQSLLFSADFKFSLARETRDGAVVQPTAEQCCAHAERTWSRAMASLGGEFASMAAVAYHHHELAKLTVT